MRVYCVRDIIITLPTSLTTPVQMPNDSGLKQPNRRAYDQSGRLIDLRPGTQQHDQQHRQHHHHENTDQYQQEHYDTSVLDVHASGNTPCQQSSGLEPVADDCAVFLNCVHGNGVRQRCGPGTRFNAERLVCDWPYNVDCGSRQLVLSGGSYAMDLRFDATNTADQTLAVAASSTVNQYRPVYEPEQGRRTVPPTPALGLQTPFEQEPVRRTVEDQHLQQLSDQLLPPFQGTI